MTPDVTDPIHGQIVVACHDDNTAPKLWTNFEPSD